MGVLTVVVILALLATIGALFIGLMTMASGGSLDRDYGERFMYWRVGLQGTAVFFMLLALYFSQA